MWDRKTKKEREIEREGRERENERGESEKREIIQSLPKKEL